MCPAALLCPPASHVLNSRRLSLGLEKKKGMNSAHEQCSETGGGQLTKIRLCES